MVQDDAMAIGGKLTEKPGGARNVIAWNVDVIRRIPVDPLDTPAYRVEIKADFYDDAAMLDFEAKVRALLPEWKP
jgi:hypothetical protein